MLVVVRVDVGCNNRAKGARFVIGTNVNGKDTSQANFYFDRTVLVEIIVPDVLWDF